MAVYMGTKSVTITLEEDLLKKIDSFVSQGYYPNRSRSIEGVVKEGLKVLQEQHIAEQAKLLDTSDVEEWFEDEIELWQEKY